MQKYCVGETGFVAISEPTGTDQKRDIAVVFRGTQAKTEWVSDVIWNLQPWDELRNGDDDIKIAQACPPHLIPSKF